MIVTFTANPSLDRTAELAVPLVRGGVHRLGAVTTQPGGKGVNVARALHLAGADVLAVLPAFATDPILGALTAAGVPHRRVDIDEPVRANLTLTEPDGTTTKLNEPGPSLDAAHVKALSHAVVESAAGADWVVLSGSLPPGAPVTWYADLVARLRPLGCKIAVDTSEAPLQAVADALPQSAPDLLKPNGEELAQLTGGDPAFIEQAALAGDLGPCIAAAQQLVARGVTAVLATLGGAGAVLVTADGAWHATPPPITVRSTVGAGDSSVSGYVLADVDGLDAPERLRRAVAYGSGAAALAGSGLPAPDQIDPDRVEVTALDLPPLPDAARPGAG